VPDGALRGVDPGKRRAARRVAGSFAPVMSKRVVCFFVLATFAAGCGGGGSQRQDADEPRGSWTVRVVDAEFPSTQRLAKQETMRITVRNDDERAVPNLAVTVEGFSRRSEQAGLADPTRPVWILDDGPRGGTTAYTNTWALGRVAPGATKTFEWRATPVVASPSASRSA
jgi:hypothetical protein